MIATAKKEKGIIANRGQGGFLCPPGHPEHSFHVQTDLRRRPENRGGMSLSYAVTCDYLEPAIKAEARALLKKWSENKPSVSSEEVRSWVFQVLGYFRNCYRNPAFTGEEQWHAGNLHIDSGRSPMLFIDDHAGVNLIRRYYPEYVPTSEDFANAQWGK